MEGMVELAEEVFHAPVRLGIPKNVGGQSETVKNPIYATGVGLIQFGLLNRGRGQLDGFCGVDSNSVWTRMRGWFETNF